MWGGPCWKDRVGQQLDALPNSLQAVRDITCAWKAGSAGHSIQAMCTVWGQLYYVSGQCIACGAAVSIVYRAGVGRTLGPSLPPAFPFPNTRILPRRPRRAVGQQVAAECSFGRGWVCTWDSARKGAEETLRNMVAASVEQRGWKSEQCNAWVLSLLANGHAGPTGHGHQPLGCKLPEPES